MKDITHYYTKAPQYVDAHKVEEKEYPEYRYVYLDVETTAETPQRPIFVVAYDPEQSKVYVGVDEQKTGIIQDYSSSEIQEIVKEEFEASGEEIKTIDYSPHIGESYLENILDDIQSFNQNRQEVKKGLCGHNVFFDLGQLGGTDEYLYQNEEMDQQDNDGVISVGSWSIEHKRAGAHGRLYTFRKNLTPDFDIKVCDTMTIAKSTYKPASLSKLAEYYEINSIDVEEEEHGILNEKYMRYNVNDVYQTKRVYEELQKEIFNTYHIRKPLHYIFSSASIAKTKMEQMGYDRVPYTDKAKSICSKAYFGGQTESLKVSEKIENVDYTDFLSQYPTGSALTNVWEFMQAESIGIRNVDNEELTEVSLEDLQETETWEEISKYYVVVKAENAMLPVRTDLNKNTTRVYKADVTTDTEGVVYNYMDVVGAELMSDEDTEIEVLETFKIFKEGKQDLEKTKIGNTTIDGNDNFMKKIIEERKRVQHIENDGEKDENTQAQKVTANSLYGCGAERLATQEKDDGEVVERVDESGKYYNPHVSTVMTAAGRLMLTIGEVVANNNGGEMYYCDTDSLLIDHSVSKDVRDYFNEMNPYNGVAGELDMLEIEEEHGTKLENVDLFAIDVKKYAILKNNQIKVMKQHGLGHYDNMRDKNSVRKFWAELLNRLGETTEEETISVEKLNEIVKWQTSASTWRIRKQLSEIEGRFVKYGDFIQRTISVENGEEIIYIGTSLDSQMIKINSTTGNVEEVESIENENCKTVSDVLNEWIGRAINNSNGRPSVRISETGEVNKEAKDIIQAYDNEVEEALEDVDMSILFEN